MPYLNVISETAECKPEQEEETIEQLKRKIVNRLLTDELLANGWNITTHPVDDKLSIIVSLTIPSWTIVYEMKLLRNYILNVFQGLSQAIDEPEKVSEITKRQMRIIIEALRIILNIADS